MQSSELEQWRIRKKEFRERKNKRNQMQKWKNKERGKGFVKNKNGGKKIINTPRRMHTSDGACEKKTTYGRVTGTNQ